MATANDKFFDRAILQIVLDECSSSSTLKRLHQSNSALLLTTAALQIQQPVLGTVRIDNYVEETVPRYSDPLFKAHFRMSRSSFQELLERVGPHMVVRTISLERRVLACLWYLANQETFRSVVDGFGMSKGSLHLYLTTFCRVMTGCVLQKLVCWPKVHEYSGVALQFSQRAGFPGVIGAIDGTYVPIPGPPSFRDSYICRKGFPAFHLQGVCDSNLRFLDVFSAFPGSVHDARAYKNSPLFKHLQTHQPPGEFHLLGDSAYGLSNSLLVPFRDNGHLSTQEKVFNFAHSSTRVDIERCFGLLKGKFRKLKFLDMKKVTDIPSVIVTCCALHNFILGKESYADDDIEGVENSSLLPENSTEILGSDMLSQKAAISKRNDIMHLLA